MPKELVSSARADPLYISSSLRLITNISRVIGDDEDARVYSIIVEHDRAVPMIEQIDQIMDALLDHDLIEGPYDRD